MHTKVWESLELEPTNLCGLNGCGIGTSALKCVSPLHLLSLEPTLCALYRQGSVLLQVGVTTLIDQNSQEAQNWALAQMTTENSLHFSNRVVRTTVRQAGSVEHLFAPRCLLYASPKGETKKHHSTF